MSTKEERRAMIDNAQSYKDTRYKMVEEREKAYLLTDDKMVSWISKSALEEGKTTPEQAFEKNHVPVADYIETGRSLNRSIALEHVLPNNINIRKKDKSIQLSNTLTSHHVPNQVFFGFNKDERVIFFDKQFSQKNEGILKNLGLEPTGNEKTFADKKDREITQTKNNDKGVER